MKSNKLLIFTGIFTFVLVILIGKWFFNTVYYSDMAPWLKYLLLK